MIGFQTAFLQQLLNIAQRERISKIPADSTENERRFCLPPLEDLRSRRHFPILSRCQPGPTEVCNTTLSGFLFSRDQQAIDHFLASLSFGGGAINQVNIHLFIETMPFGGVGYSGIGHYYGKAGFDALTHAKSVLISPPDVAIEHLFPPYTEEKVKALSQWFEY